MNTSQLRAYAPQARTAFIEAVSAQATRLGVTAKGCDEAKVEGDVLLVAGQAFPAAWAGARDRLVERVQAQGFDRAMEAIAYTWFNRFAAIRYMELHGYLGHGYRVLSHPEGGTRPEILDYAAEIDLPGLVRDQVIELKLDGTKDEGLYRLLLTAQCNALQGAMPFLFEKVGAEDEILLPANLLHSDSLIRQMVESVDACLWQDIEIIGWLYQFYISERKDQVIGKVVQPEDIPAATQLFTPNWIVKYMIQNSLGAQWLATYPSSPLKGQMDYYIEPAEQTEEVQARLKAITPESLKPEALTLIDPASGSGHILVEAYDLFKAIYLERGHRLRDVPQLILEKNLYGLDIDPRAAQLTAFALMMKGRADDKRLFERDVKLNVMALVDSTGLNVEALDNGLDLASYGLKKSDLVALKAMFERATTFGSLIQVPQGLAEKLPALRKLCGVAEADMFTGKALAQLEPLVSQVETLQGQYDAVVANPPYMGGKHHTPALKHYLKAHYEDYRKDFFSAFIDRGLALSKPHARLGFMCPFVWMFISSHEQLRKRLIDDETITSLIQLEFSAFRGATVAICTFTLQKGRTGREGSYVRLSSFPGPDNQEPRALEAIRNPDCGWFFTADQRGFKRIPGSPIAYWVSDRVRSAFTDLPSLAEQANVRQGLATSDNNAFLRLWWELDVAHIGFGYANRAAAQETKKRWFPHSKGGGFRRWYGNREFVVDWEHDGAAIKSSILRKYPYLKTPDFVAKNPSLYFHPFISWSLIGTGAAGFRWEPQGTVFGHKGPGVFLADESLRTSIMGFLNSTVCLAQLEALSPTIGFEVGQIKNLAVNSQPNPSVDRLVEIARTDWDSYETSWDFSGRALNSCNASLRASWKALLKDCEREICETKSLEEENNRLCIAAYGLEGELTSEAPIEQVTLTANPAYRYRGDLTEDESSTRFRQDTMQELISYAIGCMIGRYSLDEPGLIYANSGNKGFDAARYTTFPADEDGIVPLTDTEWFQDDSCLRLSEFLSVAWDKAHLEDNLTFLAGNLSPKKNESSRETLRRYLSMKFFKDHLKTYKKRPIYWQFSSGKKKAFQCLVYLHRYNEGTLARMRDQYVIPLLGKMAARVEKLNGSIQAATSTAHRKRLEKEKAKLEKQQVELIAFDENLRHYADMRISLDLDDGVKANYGRFGDLLAEVKAVHGKKAAVA